MFELDARLAGDGLEIGAWPLCRVLLRTDSRLPWLVLVPQRPHVVEIYDLDEADQVQLALETARAAKAIASRFQVDKINIGALGNMVPQFHMHVIGRHVGDFAWPGAAWGVGQSVPYSTDSAAAVIALLRPALGL
jgi:diadenosine tetraphosphate (Ap4A) HIT family hydrolase